MPCLVGATAVGKSDVAIALARRVGGEVIACDALTVYRGVDVLTAKPAAPPDVPHHLLGGLEPHETYSAGRFVADCDRVVEDVLGRGRVPLVVGGTALYLVSWLHGMGAAVARDERLRAELEALADREGTAALAARFAIRGRVAWVDTAGGPAFDKTDLLLAGQARAPVSMVKDSGQLTIAAAFGSGWDFVQLLALGGGMPTRVTVPDTRFVEALRVINDAPAPVPTAVVDVGE